MTSDADMPYWLKPPAQRGSAPLDPRNDKRVRRQGNENQAPVYNFNITVTGDGSSSDL
ncbi:hypothetical protein B484DRAFT_410808 [Ochromonadaceae sp. CCMP2298]|nr:hypothetical protein B484DRAFT_410808 [Ochromonadaceae sp. CCMP2298]